MKIVPVSTMQAWENETLAAETSVNGLMAEAVQGCYEFIRGKFPQPTGAIFLCGKGNNGNDGLWLAGKLAQIGWVVEVILTDFPKARKTVDSDSIRLAMNFSQVWPVVDSALLHSQKPVLIFDCLLGIGAKGEPTEKIRDILIWWQQQYRPWHVTVSIDTPSGLNADTGVAANCAFRADFTLALGAVKQGCLQGDGMKASGRIIPIPLSLKTTPMEQLPDYFDLAQSRELAKVLPINVHKYQRGDVAVFAGSPGFLGAAVLSSRAALRAGAGIVRLFCHPDCYRELSLATPEIMVAPWHGETIPAKALDADTWVIGPGFGTDQQAAEKFALLLRSATSPLLLDADALSLLSNQSAELSNLQKPVILTPHEGEFKRLSGSAVTARLVNVATWVKQHPKATVALKGPNTLVFQAGHNPSYNSSGHPGMATAGSGDVLSGVIGALLAQGFNCFDATRLGVYWHGLAAEAALHTQAEQTLTAGDIIQHLGAAWKKIRPLV